MGIYIFFTGIVGGWLASERPMAFTNFRRNLIWAFPYLPCKNMQTTRSTTDWDAPSIFGWGSLLREPRGLLERRKWEKAGPSGLLPAEWGSFLRQGIFSEVEIYDFLRCLFGNVLKNVRKIIKIIAGFDHPNQAFVGTSVSDRI